MQEPISRSNPGQMRDGLLTNASLSTPNFLFGSAAECASSITRIVAKMESALNLRVDAHQRTTDWAVTVGKRALAAISTNPDLFSKYAYVHDLVGDWHDLMDRINYAAFREQVISPGGIAYSDVSWHLKRMLKQSFHSGRDNLPPGRYHHTSSLQGHLLDYCTPSISYHTMLRLIRFSEIELLASNGLLSLEQRNLPMFQGFFIEREGRDILGNQFGLCHRDLLGDPYVAEQLLQGGVSLTVIFPKTLRSHEQTAGHHFHSALATDADSALVRGMSLARGRIGPSSIGCIVIGALDPKSIRPNERLDLLRFSERPKAFRSKLDEPQKYSRFARLLISHFDVPTPIFYLDGTRLA